MNQNTASAPNMPESWTAASGPRAVEMVEAAPKYPTPSLRRARGTRSTTEAVSAVPAPPNAMPCSRRSPTRLVKSHVNG